MVTIDYENDGEKLVIYAMDEQSLFGKVICEPEEDEVYRLRDIYVSKDWRGQGYGRALVEAAHDIIGGISGLMSCMPSLFVMKILCRFMSCFRQWDIRKKQDMRVMYTAS